MIKIDYPDPVDPKWVAWREKAEAELETLRAYAKKMANVEYEGFVAPEIKDSLYKGPRDFLMQAFNGKCAFCESRIDATQPGDVEHFRPKGAVHNDDGTMARFATKAGAERDHPGYFWLAYEWSNLLIACNTCNRSAKRNFFPIDAGCTRALTPDDIAKEKALFINPLQEDPSLQLKFEDTGMVIPLGPKGERCVEMLKLNRDALVEERKETYDNVKMKFEKYMGLKDVDPESPMLKTELEEYSLGKRKFAAQARVAISRAKTEVLSKLQKLGF